MSQKTKVAAFRTMKRAFAVTLKSPLFVLAIAFVIVIRIMRPWFLVRIGALFGHRIGHLAANTELYLCERDAGINVPTQHHVDLFFLVKPICNNELARLWKRVLRVWPTWCLAPIRRVNKLIPGWECHDIGENTQMDRDIHHLLDRFPPHLKFTPAEESKGAAGLRAIGIEQNAKFVCLLVRDSAYLKSHQPAVDYSYHDYRDCNVHNFIMASEELARRGYYVVRMGVVVKEPMKSKNPRVIDYEARGMRTEFMDIYLGSKCEFCISVGSGFDALPYIFRRPIVFVDHVPPGYLFTFGSQFIGLTKHYFSTVKGRCLTLAEILSEGLGFAYHVDEYAACGIQLVENTPEEIRDVVVEMVQRLEGSWQPHCDDEELQRRFWSIFPSNSIRNGKPLHGEIRSRFGASFLRSNRWWLDSLS